MARFVYLHVFESNRFGYYWKSVILPTLRYTIVHRPRKLLNLLHSVIERTLKRTRLKSRPSMFKIEAAVGCNLKCPLCVEMKSRQLLPNNKWIRHEDYEVMHRKISKDAIRISYYIFGEPLVNPHMSRIVNTAASDNIFTYFCSNFTLASKPKVEEFVNAGLAEVSVPLDGWTQEQYEKYRVGGDVSVLKSGIKHLVQYRRKLKQRWPLIKVNTIRFDHYKEDMDKIQEFCEEAEVDSYVVKPNLEFVECNTGPRPYSTCFWPWYTMLVDTDGTVMPCIGQQRQKDIDYGNLLEDDLESIWNGPNLLKIREFLTSNDKDQYSAEDVPCINCTRYC